MPWASRRSRRDPNPRNLVRAGAAAGLAAAILTPLVRKRLRIPGSVTVAALAAGPLAIAVLKPRSKVRDAALYFQQMWGFIHAHELPYDDPEALQRRLKVTYPIRFDRMLGCGELPNARLQRALGSRSTALDKTLTWAHWLWFLEPHTALVWILVRRTEQFPRAARQVAAVYDIGCSVYFAVPTAPPWWAAANGYTGEERINRIMIPIGEETWGRAWPRMYGSLDTNPWAAMPSLHFGSALMAAVVLSDAGFVEGLLGWSYALTLGFALVYLGEHYVGDLIAGAALVAAVRAGDPFAEPVVGVVNGRLQWLERIANG
ncbi:MAG: phosphatase PAP2 family protein [Solirubrobacterales bacterium]